jgi:ATP-dependent exoDNAse (exonuclease V) alpha subunit
MVKIFPQVADIVIQGGLDVAAICGFNKTRTQINALVRRMRGFDGPAPDPGDLVVCLKNRDRVLFNGMRGVLREISADVDEKGRTKAVIDFPDDGFRIREAAINLHQFNRDKTFDDLTKVPGYPKGWWDAGLLFDYGYAITCHKSQGSQWREVVIRHEIFPNDTDDNRRRWIYTAVTRAAERVYVIP